MRARWWSASAVLLVALLGCRHGADVRLDGSAKEILRKVEAGNRTPRNAAARSYADALATVGRADKARAVLLADYRHGGDVDSLVALGRLERSLGLDGTALLHESRVLELSPRLLRGRPDVCAGFRERARQLAALGDPRAALEDLDYARMVCTPGMLRADALAEDRRQRARWRDDLRVVQARQRSPLVDSSSAPAVAPADPMEARQWSHRHHASLPPATVARLMGAELRGELGIDLVVADELRMWVGETSWRALEPALAPLPAAERAYATYRLQQVVPVPIEGDPTLMPQPTRLDTGPGKTLEEVEGSFVHRSGAWRVFVLAGDLGAAELTLTTVMRERLDETSQPDPAGVTDAKTGTEAKTEPGPGESEGVAAKAGRELDYWVKALPIDAETLGQVLALARFRRAAGQDDLALRLTLWVTEHARRAEVPATSTRVLAEARRHLALGRPWHALAVAEASATASASAVSAAAATAIELCGRTDAACGRTRDEAVVSRVVGEAWMNRQRAELRRLALAGGSLDSQPAGCPTPAELRDTDSAGALSRVFERASGATVPDHAATLRVAIESDLALVCAGRLVVPILAAQRRGVIAGALVEMWSHAATMSSYLQLELHGQLAMVAERPRQAALLLRRAAALAPDPQRVWSRTARLAQAMGDLDFAIVAQRQRLLLRQDLAGADIRLPLLMAELQRMHGSWAAKHTEVGAASIQTQIEEYLEQGPAVQGWWRRQQLADALRRSPWADAEFGRLVAPVLWPSAVEKGRHPWASAAWTTDSASMGQASALDVAAVVSGVVSGAVKQLPAPVAAFAAAAWLDEVRLALAMHAPAADVRYTFASAVAAHGDAAARQRATAVLLDLLARRKPARDAVAAWVVRGPSALSARGSASEPLLLEVADVVQVAAGLPLDPPVGAR